MEALSRGAKSIHFIENNKATLPVLYQNVKEFQLPLSSIIEEDVQHLGQASEPFDLVFLDPPYHKGLLPSALERLSSQGWFSKNTTLVMEMAKDEDPPLEHNLSLLIERFVGAAKFLFFKVI